MPNVCLTKEYSCKFSFRPIFWDNLVALVRRRKNKKGGGTTTLCSLYYENNEFYKKKYGALAEMQKRTNVPTVSNVTISQFLVAFPGTLWNLMVLLGIFFSLFGSFWPFTLFVENSLLC